MDSDKISGISIVLKKFGLLVRRCLFCILGVSIDFLSIVDMDEIGENEFNLNIPRYVDTFEPEEQIDLKEAIADFKKAMQTETMVEKELEELLKTIDNEQ